MALPQLVEVDYDEFVHETEKGGMLFVIDEKEVWLPASVIEVDTDSKTITMPRSLAKDKGLI
jgi:hypothetical protein